MQKVSFHQFLKKVFLLCFGACHRNEELVKRGVKFPTPVKTGTTIAGIVFKVRECTYSKRRSIGGVCFFPVL